jgi:hypothetical protein
MPAKNIHHDAVVEALVADGWTITDDPLRITYGGRNLFVDLGAEQGAIGAEKGGEKIAVEIQSFLSPSPIHDLEHAVGQYDVYRAILAETEPERTLHLAVPHRVADSLLAEQIGHLIISRVQLKVLVFDEIQKKVVSWIK